MTVGLESRGRPRPEVAVGAIAVDAERLLLVRRGHGPAAGLWSVPGGRVEPGEMLVEAVVRELAEETGLEGVADRFVGWVERIGEGYHYVILDFIVTVLEPRDPVAGADAAEAASDAGANNGHGAAPSVDSLAIPGYDTLSASQVVQRLGGLSADELEAVRAYEEASRKRKTILARVEQLQSGS